MLGGIAVRQNDRFSAAHPAVTFLFFAGVIVFAVIFQHPAYLAASVLGAAACLLSLRGRAAWRTILGMVPLFLVLSLLNPLFNTRGDRVLLTVLGRPYTLEALYYGMAIAGMLVAVLLWFLCYSQVMTSDKFTCLFGNLIPALSLLLVMVLRLIPAYQRKTAQISGARRCIGKSPAGTSRLRDKVMGGMTVLSALTTWALEGSVVTADAMRCRGYGTARRSSFQIYRFTAADGLLLAAMLALMAATITAASLGWTAASYTPELRLAPVAGPSIAGLAAYAALLLIPAMLNLWEALKWHSLRSKI